MTEQWSLDELEDEIADRDAGRGRYPVKLGVVTVFVVMLGVIAVGFQKEIRAYLFPAQEQTTNDLSLTDVANEEGIIRELEAKYEWLWIMEVHRMADGTVSILSGIHPDSQETVSAIPKEEWQAISLHATEDIINAFSPAARNGVVYMRYARPSNFTMVGVLLCDTMGSRDSTHWNCQGAAIQPPVAIEPDWVEFEDRLAP